jgi:predicted ATPase/DNA-binding SARP family transcriptional activator
MEYRILGPLQVISGGRELALPRAKQRALVLALLLKPNEVVSTDRLTEALWGESPPATASSALQGHVSRLRKLLPPDTLLTRPTGYELRVRPAELDLDRFLELRAQARTALDVGEPAEAARLLDEALSLWRGPPLADLAYDAFAEAEIGRLEELRAESIEEQLEAQLALGRHGEVVAELEALVRAEPFRERRRGLLMLALYRAGRQAEALDVFQEGRRRLVDELGIEPGPALQELQQRILAQDPTLRPEASQAKPLPTVTREARRAVTVVACGLELDGVDPEAMRESSERQLGAVHTIVERHGGVVERELMDLAVATFGASAAYEDAPMRAARAAIDVRDELGARVAVTSGEAVVAASGTIGEPVAIAQRLQLLAAPGDILLDQATGRLLRDVVDVESEGDALRVLHVDRGARGAGRRLDSPLVGRAHEVQQLERALERASDERSPQLVTVVGQAGVGKTRLVAEVLRRAGETLVLRGRCLSYGEGIAFWPVRELVRGAVGLDENAPVGAVEDALRGLLDDGDAAALAGLFGAGEPEASTDDLQLAFRALVERLAAEQPVIVMFDDLEHAEPALLDLIDFVAEWSRDVALTVICVGRPELLERRPAWGGGRASTISVALDALGTDDCVALIENLLGGAHLPGPAIERLIAAAGGNPLYLEQLVSMLIDDGQLRLEDGSWTTAGDLASVRVPSSIQLLIAARLDRLQPTDLSVLECAAVAGVVFQAEAVEAMLDGESDSGSVATAVRSLVAKGLVRPTTTRGRGEAYRFRHLLIRDAAYSAIPKEARGRLHEQFAHFVEQTASDRLVELEEVLGHHLEQAYRLLADIGRPDPYLAADAAGRLGAAGTRAHARGDYESAAGLLRRAGELAAAAGSPRLDLLPLLLSALRLSGRLPEARRAGDDALAQVREAGDRRLQAHILLEQWTIMLLADPAVELDEVAAVAEDAIATFEAAGDEPGLARANALAGEVFLFRCRLQESEEANERALLHARRAEDGYVASIAQASLCQASFLGPREVASGIERCEQVFDTSDATPATRASSFAVRGVLEAMRENLDAARACIAASRALGEEFGLERNLAALPGFAACVEMLADDPDRAEAELRLGYAALERIGETAVLETTAALLAQALVERGDVDGAKQLVADWEDRLSDADMVSRIYWCQARSRVHARRGELAAAETAAREAVALAATTDMLSVHGMALIDLARTLPVADRADVLRDALALFEAKGDLVGARRARDAAQ